MPASLRELRQRRKSVSATKKITRAMELIASSRIIRAQQAAARALPYTRELNRAVSAVANKSRLDHPLTRDVEDPRRVAVLFITSDRGMNGAYSSNVIKTVAALDLVRRDSAMFDVAVALVLECADPGGEALDAGLVHAFMAGYGAGGRLAIEQARLVLPLVRAAYTWQGMAALLSWKAGSGPDAIERLQRIAERRLPALDARRVELTEAVEAAAG